MIDWDKWSTLPTRGDISATEIPDYRLATATKQFSAIANLMRATFIWFMCQSLTVKTYQINIRDPL
jgi:hypothetical protein